MLKTLAAAALIATLPVASFAASHTTGIDQMKAEIMDSTVLTGMEIDLDSLTDDQIGEISGILAGEDSDDDKRMAIEAILN